MNQRLTVVTLGVTDLTRSRVFYEALGWKSSASSLGQFLGPVVGGSLISRHQDLPFLMAGILLIAVSAGIAIAHRRPKRAADRGHRHSQGGIPQP